MTRGERLRLLRTARGLDASLLATRAGLSGAGVGKIENGESAGREATLGVIVKALDVSRLALDDDAECFRELARVCGVPLPTTGATPEGEIVEVLRSVPAESRAGLVAMFRGMVQAFAPRTNGPPRGG